MMRKRVVVSVFWIMGIFSLSVTAADPIKIAAIFAQTGIAARTAIVLKIVDEEYSLTLAESFVNAFQHYGGNVLDNE
jgi:hypothetical protein